MAGKKGTAICTNMTVIDRGDLGGLLLEAAQHYLIDEEAVRVFCKVYVAERNHLEGVKEANCRHLERELLKAVAEHKTLVDAIVAGVPP